MTVDDCIKEYETLGDRIFGRGRWFSVRGPLPATRDKYSEDRFKDVIDDVVERRLPGPRVLKEAFASPRHMCRT